jgi:hypothetical protein
MPFKSDLPNIVAICPYFKKPLHDLKYACMNRARTGKPHCQNTSLHEMESLEKAPNTANFQIRLLRETATEQICG